MFGTNVVYGTIPAPSEDAENVGVLKLVTRPFVTFQGEGPFAGRPAVFLRLAHCNLQCRMCDTAFDQGFDASVGQVAQMLRTALTEYYPNDDLETVRASMILVITGGEPLLQRAMLRILLRSEVGAWKAIQVETNGILLKPDTAPPDLLDDVVFVVSPKVNEYAYATDQYYLKPRAESLKRANYLKFVLSADEDSPYHVVPDWAYDFKSRDRIFVSPMNVVTAYGREHLLEAGVDRNVAVWRSEVFDHAKIARNHAYAAEYAVKHRLRFTMQQHIFAGLP